MGLVIRGDSDYSAVDSRRLPRWWTEATDTLKVLCHRRLKEGWPVHIMPAYWRRQLYEERMRVINHYIALGHFSRDVFNQVPKNFGTDTGRLKSPGMDFSKSEARITTWLQGDWTESTIAAANKLFEDLPSRPAEMHHGPNGGLRILPSVYTRLTTHWLQRNGDYIEPVCMNEHHLKCSIALLHESHGNYVARACLLMGKVHAHIDCAKDVQAHMEAACLELQKLDISSMYHIFDLLANEYQRKISAKLPMSIDDLWRDTNGLEF